MVLTYFARDHRQPPLFDGITETVNGCSMNESFVLGPRVRFVVIVLMFLLFFYILLT
jgi:hypothetical protein